MLSVIKPECNFSQQEFEEVLKADMVSTIVKNRKHNPIQKNDVVGVRLNLNLVKMNPSYVFLTIHRGEDSLKDKEKYKKNRSFFTGEILDYSRSIYISNAFFNVNQLAREQVASGMVANFPMASVDGSFESKEIPVNFTGTPVRFNPRYQHLFVDEDGFAIRYAEEVVILGHRAYACGKIVYHHKEDAPKQMGRSATLTKFKKENFEIYVSKTHVGAIQNRELML